MTEDEKYKITVTGPGHKFERTIEATTANQILNLIMTGAVSPTSGVVGRTPGSGGGASGGGASDISTLNPKQFIAQKKPKTQYERIACLAYYLTTVRNTPQFGTEEITALNTEAAQATIKNAPVIVRDTTLKYKYLSAAADRNKQITALGEAVVEALPDREAVAAAIAEYRTPKGRKRATKKK